MKFLIQVLCLVLVGLFASGLSQAQTSQKLASHTLTVGDKTFRFVLVKPSQLNLHWKNTDGQAYGSVIRLKKALTAQGKNVLVIMNAGIYSTNDTPAGLHVENGQVLKKLNTQNGRGNFHLQPNGVLLVTASGHANIVTTAAYRKRFAGKENTLKLATQSGPMLLINGKINTKFIPSSPSEYTRNGACTTATGKLYFLATDNFPSQTSNLYHFARAAKTLGCDNALYLDGSISKLYVNGEDAAFHLSHYVGLLSVTTD